MRVEIYVCPGNIAYFSFVQVKKRRIKSRLKNVQVRGGYLEYLRHYFFIAMHTSFSPLAIFMHKWQHIQCNSNMKTTPALRSQKTWKCSGRPFHETLPLCHGASFSFICPFIHLFTHPFIDSFIYFHSFISLVQLLVSSFILFLFYSVWSFLFSCPLEMDLVAKSSVVHNRALNRL